MDKKLLILVLSILIVVALGLIYLKSKTDSEDDFLPPVSNNQGVNDIRDYHKQFGDYDPYNKNL